MLFHFDSLEMAASNAFQYILHGRGIIPYNTPDLTYLSYLEANRGRGFSNFLVGRLCQGQTGHLQDSHE